MNPTTVIFTDNARQDLADIRFFQEYIQEIPTDIAINIGVSLREKTSNILTYLPNAGTLYGFKGAKEVRTIVTMHKYMIYYHYDEVSDTVNILHVFCTLMDDKFLRNRLLEEGIYTVR